VRVLVTGGAGYIGSVVGEELLAAGHGVVVYDDLSKGHRDAVPEAAAFVEADLLDRPTLERTLVEHRIDAVVHMAARSLVSESVRAPAIYYRSNVIGSLTLADAMLAAGVHRLVFSSTAALYGEPAKQPIEEDDPTRPTNPYGETKLAFERALAWYSAATPLRTISLRYFNAAGASARSGERHDPESHLVPLVLRAALRGEAIAVFGNDYPTPDGTCVRDYIHVIDLARAHVLALEALAAGRPSRAYNLGGGSGASVRQVIDVARRVTGRAIAVRDAPRRPGDPAVLVASSARIQSELGWRPAHESLDDIIASAWRLLPGQNPG
jgi:UDP-glucose 4-epimerase